MKLPRFTTYEVVLRDKVQAVPGCGLCADIYRVTWFGLFRTLVNDGVSASRVDFENLIRKDFIKTHNFIEYAFTDSAGTIHRDESCYIRR